VPTWWLPLYSGGGTSKEVEVAGRALGLGLRVRVRVRVRDRLRLCWSLVNPDLHGHSCTVAAAVALLKRLRLRGGR